MMLVITCPSLLYPPPPDHHPQQGHWVTGRCIFYLMTIWMDLSEIKHTRLIYRTILTPHMQGLTNFDHGVGLWWWYFGGLALY